MGRRVRRGELGGLILIVGCWLSAPGPLIGQADSVVPDCAIGVTPSGIGTLLLPLDHWAARAAVRAEALGLVPGYQPAQRSVPREVVWGALCAAESRAAGGPYAELVRGWRERLEEEVGAGAAGRPHNPVRSSGFAGAGMEHRAGLLAPGIGEFPPVLRAPAPLPEATDAVAVASVAAGATRRIGIAATVEAGSDVEVTAPHWEAALRARGVRLSLGRTAVGYGPAVGGSVVLGGGGRPLTRVSAESARPFRFPGLLRFLGPASVHSSIARVNEPNRHPGEPYFWTARGTLRPHPRLSFGLSRAAFFGGDSVATPVTAINLARLLVGKHTKAFENQIVAGEARWRMPTEGLLPLTFYAELGGEDSAGAFYNVPGLVVGFAVPALPRLPQVEAGLEYARFGGRCCGNPPWYRHSTFPGNWVLGNRPLGHPLGGEGREFSLFTAGTADHALVRWEARGWIRQREGENLYAPLRGESTGAAGGIAWRLAPSREATLSLSTEAGDGWHERALRAGVAILF